MQISNGQQASGGGDARSEGTPHSGVVRWAHRCALVVVLSCCVTVVPAWADYLVVGRRVSVKSGPSAASQPVKRVEVGQTLVLLSSVPTDNYYKVDYPPGTASWIYQGFVTVHPGSPPASGVTAAGDILKVHVINVGQGDATLVICPDGEHQLLIDAGDTRYPGSSTAFKSAMAELQGSADAIEAVVATHPHADHIGNMPWLLREYSVGVYVDNGTTYDSATYRRVGDAIRERGIRRERANEPTVPNIDFCPRADVNAIVLRPPSFGDSRNPNDNSVVVRLDYRDSSFLFVGDAEEDEEEALLHSVAGELDCDFLKVGHHGSDTSSTQGFLDAVTPEIASISAGLPGVGTNAGYMHPRRSTVERLLRYLATVPGRARRLRTYDAGSETWRSIDLTGALYVTALEGDLLFESDGNKITFQQDH